MAQLSERPVWINFTIDTDHDTRWDTGKGIRSCSRKATIDATGRRTAGDREIEFLIAFCPTLCPMQTSAETDIAVAKTRLNDVVCQRGKDRRAM